MHVEIYKPYKIECAVCFATNRLFRSMCGFHACSNNNIRLRPGASSCSENEVKTKMEQKPYMMKGSSALTA